MRLTRLGKLEGGDWPLAIVAFDRDSQAMPFVEPNVLDRSSLSVGKDHRLANEFGPSLFERAEDGDARSITGAMIVSELTYYVSGDCSHWNVPKS